MKKKIFMLTLIFSVLLFTGKVKAIYNGQGASVTISGGGSSKCNGSNCQFNNTVYGPYLQIQLWYIDSTNGSWSQIGDTYYITSPGNYSYLNNNLGVSSSHIIQVSSLSGVNPLNYAEASRRLRSYFGDDDNSNIKNIANQNLVDFLNAASGGDYTAVLTKDTEVANKSKMAKKGYRVIIEPAIAYINTTWNGGGGGIMSPKDAAVYRKRTGASFNICSLPLSNDVPTGCANKKMDRVQSKFLYTEFDDVGIKAHGESWCSDISVNTLADENIGCGFNIIDVGKFIEKHYCYDKTVSGSLTCVNYDKNNEETFKEKYTKRECTSEEDLKDTNSEYGKKIGETNNCTLYCIEDAFASLPGGIKNAREIIGKEIAPGSYFAWPARYGASYGMKMRLESSLKCTIVDKDSKTCSSSDITTLHDKARGYADSNLKFGAHLTGGSNKEIKNEKLTLYNETTSLSNSSSKTFTLTKSAYLEIPNNKNRYVNKGTGEVSDTKKTGAFQFDRQEGVISLKIDEEPYKQYSLKLTDIVLGTTNQYGKRINNYSCHYTLEDTCTCPPEYYNSGKSLSLEMETLGLSCVEAQEKFCKCSCPNDASCGEEGKDLSDKVTEQTTKACKEAQEKYCYHNYCKTSEGKRVDISGCISEQMAKGRTKGEAANICEDKYCPGVCGNTCVDKHGKTIDISGCINEGHSYQICYFRYCSKVPCVNGICNYACTENCKWSEQKKGNSYIQYVRTCSNNESGEDCGNIRIPCVNGICNKCVITKLESKLKGASILNGLNSGKISQVDLMGAVKSCYNDKKLPKIVYRTIDLNNPFPGKSGAARYQGYNWDSKQMINSKILNGRGEKGEALYNKTPLYTITLTPDTIKRIKTYNKQNHPYSDFTLKCKSENGTTACISSFVHDPTYVKIDTKNSVAKCYKLNVSKSEWDFVNCYEMNN